MTKALHRLIYYSHNRLEGGWEAVEAEIRTILGDSRRNNAAAGVTGALIFNAGVFGQVLEGPIAAVEATFERIQLDERHGDVTLLELGPIAERSFGAWSMAFVGASAENARRFGDIAASSGFRPDVMDREHLHQVLVDLVREEERGAT